MVVNSDIKYSKISLHNEFSTMLRMNDVDMGVSRLEMVEDRFWSFNYYLYTEMQNSKMAFLNYK